MSTNEKPMTIGHAYYTAIVIANTRTIAAEDYAAAKGCPPVTQRDMTTIREQSNLVATKFPLKFNGVVTTVEFPDGSSLCWDKDRGFAHPGN